ncbi:MAG: DUF4118 domain-containing protein [Erysipelotrichaceae bacterium]|nr:DUF4118 domain-containing protein [Erysipelotrichaceae bacterium]
MNQKENLAKNWLVSVSMCIVPILIGFLFVHNDQSIINIIMVYLLCSVLTARFTSGIKYALFVSCVSILTLNFFFVKPHFEFTFYDFSYLVSFTVIFLVTTLTSIITAQARTNERKAIRREEEANILYRLASELSSTVSRREIVEKGLMCVNRILHCTCGYFSLEEESQTSSFCIFVNEDGQTDVRQTCTVFKKPEKADSQMIRGPLSYQWPIQGFKGFHGYLDIPVEKAEQLTDSDLSFVGAVADTLSIALGRLITLEDEQRVAQEAEQERYKANLLRSISHDIRNPLTGIMGTAQLIMNETPDQPDIRQMAGTIRKQSSWLLELVANILSLTRLQSGAVALNKEVEIVEDVIAEAISQVKVRTPNRTVRFEPPAEVIAARMDPKLIQQVVINLIDNAFKHTKPDEEVWLELKQPKTPDWVSIEVHDRGEGLSEEAKKKIFEIFYTTHDKDKDAKKGYGLGLPICDSIMKAHGGCIQADNNPDGKGAVFTVSFPADMNG